MHFRTRIQGQAYCDVVVAAVVDAAPVRMTEGLASMMTVRVEVAVRPDWSVAT